MTTIDERARAGVRTAVDGAVATITLDRAPANRLAPDIMGALRSSLLEADDRPAVRAIVLTGAGETFCGGLDAERLADGGDPVVFAQALIDLLRVFPRLGTPVIAAVNGDALASGFSLVCAADFAVAVASARLGTIEASAGMWPMIAQVPVIHRLPARLAAQNVMTGVPFVADDLARWGLINGVVDNAGALPAAAAQWVEAATRSGATAAGRRVFHRMLDAGWDGALDEAMDEFVAMARATT
jgi:enoyl-CoA hydratase/carnithine racemase